MKTLLYLKKIAVFLIMISGLLYSLSALSVIGTSTYTIQHETEEHNIHADRRPEENSTGSHNIITAFIVLSVIALSVILIIMVKYLVRRLNEKEKQINAQSNRLNVITEQQTEVEKHYLSLFNRINDGVVVSYLSPEGEFSSIRDMNKQACLILGRTEERLKSIRIKDLFEESEQARIPDLINRLQTKHTHLFETRIVTEEGVVRNVEINCSLTDTNGAGWKVIAVIRDISDRISREGSYIEKLNTLKKSFEKRTRELEEANQEINLFAGTVSHDLQAPLRTVHDSLIRIQKRQQIDDPEIGKELELCISQTQKTGALIKGILEYSRLGRNVLELKPVGLSQICSEVLLQLDSIIRTEDADVKIERPMPRVIAHANTLFRVIQNLVTNAVKYVEPGIKSRVIMRAESRNGIVRLWIIDNGIGIAPEYQKKIFEVFERLHSSEEYPGIGLGLAIVKRGVQRMNGSIGLLSEVGEGSRFWIELPAAADGRENADATHTS